MTVAHLEYVDRALDIVGKAKERDIDLRILGSLAYRLHCPAHLHLFDEMERDLTDVDFAASSRQRKEVRALLEGLGYVIDQDLLVTSEGKRYAFSDPGSAMVVDVFFDELFFCHPIPLRDRLALDYPTITPTDLLLEKMQIVEINPKDIKDTLVLLLEHPVDSTERADAIDAGYIARLLAGDWGFYHTVTTNLGRLERHVAEYGALGGENWKIVSSKVEELLRRIEAEPKGGRWKLRARIGPRVKWYQEVAEKSKTY
jgi:hypothetical protein